jgi:hypothetical protein
MNKAVSSLMLGAILCLWLVFLASDPHSHNISGMTGFAGYTVDPDMQMVRSAIPLIREGQSEDSYCTMGMLIRPPYRCQVYRRWFDDIEQRDI